MCEVALRLCNFFPVYDDRKHEDYKFFNNVILYYEVLKPKLGPNVLPMSRVCHNLSFQDEYLLVLAFEARDMFHGTFNYGLIKIRILYRFPMRS